MKSMIRLGRITQIPHMIVFENVVGTPTAHMAVISLL